MRRSHQEKVRLGVLFVALCLFFTLALSQLVHLQVFLSSKYGKIVRNQSSGVIPIPASRGLIYDCKGKIVANNVFVSSLYANPINSKELRRDAAYLGKIFNLKPKTAIKRFGLAVNRFRWIKRRLNDSLADIISREAPRGLHLREEAQREYPFGLTGKQILGFTNIDNRGLSGLELSYDSLLAGKSGKADYRRDGLRNTYRVKETALVKPIPGRSMILTADWRLQEILEEELKKGVRKYKAKSGMAVFLDCNSGAILATACYDTADTNPQKPMKLRPVTDQFEPGSIFKVITAAGLLDRNMVDFKDTTFCEKGRWKIDGRTLHDDKEHGWLTFRQIMELSSNIGVAKYAIKEGGEALYETAQRFNIGHKLEIDWPGETSGKLVNYSRWSDYRVASLAMGHSVAVTPLQMAACFAAIANGGNLYRPGMVFGYVDSKGQVVKSFKPQLISRVMKKASADTLVAILRGVVERGTAEAVNSSVVSIAGKTGTAQIPKPSHRGYYYSRYMASFAGFFPYEKPLVAGIVILEAPQPIHYGGWTAGPIFRKIAERYVMINPDLFVIPDRMLTEKRDKSDSTAVVPNLIGYSYTQAKALAADEGVELRSNNDSGMVVWQFPSADRLIFKSDEILVAVKNPSEKYLKMADLTGFSIRKGLAFLKLASLKFTINGSGRVVKQSIRAGEFIKPQAICRLKCRPI